MTLHCSLDVLAAILAERDSSTHAHGERVGVLSRSLGLRCGLGAMELQQLDLAARFHDIGKIGVPDHILLKPGPLDPHERGQMAQHCERGERIFLATGRQDAAWIGRIIRHHHEAFDGSGYPDGLAGEAIPLLARIVRLTDSYDAMASVRPYQRQRRSHARIMQAMHEERGRKHDPDLFDVFAAMIDSHPARTA